MIGKVVPKSHIAQTGISLKATAGLRQLPQQSQDWLIEVVRICLATSGFSVDPLETRVIDGREEAFFGWMTVAIAFKIHQTIFSAPQMKYFGALDMGGASKQIAFILREESCSNENSDECSKKCKADWMLRSQGFLFLLFVT
jgi:Golgi nucleoside diphosphatase